MTTDGLEVRGLVVGREMLPWVCAVVTAVAPISSMAGPPDANGSIGPQSAESERRPWIHRPIPMWKTVGLATSAGVAGTATFVALALSIPTLRSRQGKGRLTEEIEAEAEASLGTEAPVDPDQGTSRICAQALSQPAPDQPGRVYNASVGELCVRGQKMALGGTVAWGIAGAGLVSTAVFTGLLFLRPKGASGRALRRDRQVWFAAGPSPQRGWSVATRVRF